MGKEKLQACSLSEIFLAKKKAKAEYDKVYRATHKKEIDSYREAHRAELKVYRDAHKQDNKAYREAHKDELKVKHKLYHATHCEEIKARKKEYYKKHGDKIRADRKLTRIRNRDILNKQQKEYRAAHTEKQKLYRLSQRYKITPEQYTELFLKQKHACAICGCIKELCVDHSHTTGDVRGLLCRNCNHLLGNANDNPETLRKAIKYLE